MLYYSVHHIVEVEFKQEEIQFQVHCYSPTEHPHHPLHTSTSLTANYNDCPPSIARGNASLRMNNLSLQYMVFALI